MTSSFRRLFYTLCLLLPLAIRAPAQSTSLPLPIHKVLQLAQRRYAAYMEKYPDGNLHLYSIRPDGTVQSVTYKDWTSGFFPGALWKLFDLTGDPRWKKNAIKWTLSLSPAQWLTTKHDIGFILFTSAGNGYSITHDTVYSNILHQAARSLATRFNPTVGSIRSWDNGPWSYPVIVDNQMNLELLFWAATTFGDTSLRHAAVSHLRNELLYRSRPDGSTLHVLDFDPATGRLLARKTWQGLADSSCWARGQAWDIYGLTMAYRYTHITAYLQQAIKAADYFIGKTASPADAIPRWDFDDPSPDAPKDASAAAIAASALLELADYVPAKKQGYLLSATRILQRLCSPDYIGNDQTKSYFLLDHSVVNKPAGKGVDVPVIYADYYFLEALERFETRK
jgi:hypothetical protein